MHKCKKLIKWLSYSDTEGDQIRSAELWCDQEICVRLTVKYFKNQYLIHATGSGSSINDAFNNALYHLHNELVNLTNSVKTA